MKNRLLAVVCGFLLLAVAAKADTVTIDFDSVNATGGFVDATSYLASYGVTLSGVTAGTQVSIMDYNQVYGGTALNPVSGPNLLQQTGSNAPVSFTLTFSNPLLSFTFVVPDDAAPSTFPAWQAYAYSGTTLVASTGKGYTCCMSGPVTYSLVGSGITSVRIDSQNGNFAGFSAVPLDNLTLVSETSTVPEPATLLLTGSGILGLGWRRFRG